MITDVNWIPLFRNRDILLFVCDFSRLDAKYLPKAHVLQTYYAMWYYWEVDPSRRT